VASRKEQKEQARLDREAKERELAASSARKRRMYIIGGVVGIALVAVLVAVAVSSGIFKSKNTQGADVVTARFQGIPQRGVELGDKNAPATIVEFADLKCPFCQQFALKGMPQLISSYIATGKAKMVYRNLTILNGS
jgi:protein-disulfide isomerase